MCFLVFDWGIKIFHGWELPETFSQECPGMSGNFLCSFDLYSRRWSFLKMSV